MNPTKGPLFVLVAVLLLAAGGTWTYIHLSGDDTLQADSEPRTLGNKDKDRKPAGGGDGLTPEKWMTLVQKPAFRAEAMQQLDKNPDLGTKILPLLEQQTKSDQLDERRRAYEILDHLTTATNPALEPTIAKAVELLLAGSKEPDPTVRVIAVKAIGKLDPHVTDDEAQRKQILQTLRKDLKSIDESLRLVSALVLARIARRGDGGPLDIALLDAKTFAGQWERIALHEITKPDDRAVVGPLGKGLTDPDSAIRLWSAQALENLAPSILAVREVIPQLTEVFQDPDDEAGTPAATALGNLAVREPEAMAVAIAGLQSDDPKIRQRAALLLKLVHLLVRVQPLSPEVKQVLVQPKSVEVLGAALGSDQADVRQQAVATLELVGAKAKPAVEQLLAALESDDVDVQRSAALALGAVGADGMQVIPALANLLGSEHPALRESVAHALAHFGAEARPIMTNALEDPTPYVREGAATALGQMGPTASTSIPALTKTLEDENVSVQVASALALYRITGQTDKELPVLVKVLQEGNTVERLDASEALQQIGPAAEAAVPALAKALSDEERGVRRHAVQTLVQLGPRALDAIPALVAILEQHPATRRGESVLLDSDEYLSQLVVDAIRAVGPSAKAAEPALVQVLEAGPDLIAADALTWIAPTNTKAVPALRRALEQGFQNEKDRAARALARLGVRARSAIPALVQQLANDPREDSPVKDALVRIGKEAVPALLEASKNPSAQIAVFRVLGRLGPDAAQALPMLESAVGDPQTTILATRTLGDLAEHGEKQAVDVLVKLLDNELSRVTAIEALGGAGELAKPAVPRLLELFEKAQGQERQALLIAFGRLGTPAKEAQPLLEKALDDADELTRIGVALALIKVGGSAKKAGEALATIFEKSKQSEIRASAVMALGVVSRRDKEFVPLVKKALSDTDPNVRFQALGIVREDELPLDDATPLLDALKSDDDRLRIAGCLTLEKAGIAAKQALPLVTSLLDDPNEQVRFAAVTALGQMGADAKEALPALRKAFVESSATRVPPPVLLAMWKIDKGQAVETVRALMGYLDRPHATMQMRRAIFALGELGADANLAVPKLCLLLDASNQDIARGAAAAIEKIGEPTEPVKAYLRRTSESEGG